MGFMRRKAKRIKAAVRKYADVLFSMEMEHVVACFSFDPLAQVVLVSTHVATGFYSGKFCGSCWDLKKFDAPLC